MMKCALCVEEEFYKLHTTIMIPRTRLLKVEKRQLVTISLDNIMLYSAHKITMWGTFYD